MDVVGREQGETRFERAKGVGAESGQEPESAVSVEKDASSAGNSASLRRFAPKNTGPVVLTKQRPREPFVWIVASRTGEFLPYTMQRAADPSSSNGRQVRDVNFPSTAGPRGHRAQFSTGC